MGEKTGSNRLVIILLTLTLIVLIGIAVTIGYLYVFKGAKTATATVKSGKVIEEKTLSLEEFIVNLADEDKGFIKIKIVLAFTDKKVEKEIQTKMPQVRSTVIKELRKKTSKDFSNGGEDKVIKELVEKINGVLDNGKITNIYLYDIVIQ